MIDIISNWAGELVVSLMIVTLIEMLLPDNKIKKYVKTVIGIYIIFCIISPFINKQEFWTIFENTEKTLEKIQIENQVATVESRSSNIESLYIQEFEKEVIKKVEEFGYEIYKCEVNIEIDATKENAGINAIYLVIGNKKITENNNEQIDTIQKIDISINNKEEGNNNSEKENENTKEVKEFLSSYYEISQERIKIVQN